MKTITLMEFSCMCLLLVATGCGSGERVKWHELTSHPGYEELLGVQVVNCDGISTRIFDSARIEETGSGDYLVMIAGETPCRFASKEEALEYASQCVDARNAATIQSLEAAPKKMKR